MFYPTYKCKMCNMVETDYSDGQENLYTPEMKLCSNLHKIHVCDEFEGCKTIGVMEIIGFHQRDE